MGDREISRGVKVAVKRFLGRATLNEREVKMLHGMIASPQYATASATRATANPGTIHQVNGAALTRFFFAIFLAPSEADASSFNA